MDTDGDGIGDRCYVTGVKLQNPFGTCWGFAAISAAETSILSTILEDDPDAWKTLDLSEKQLAYFASTYLNDPESSQNGEGVHVPGTSASDTYKGGKPFLATQTFAMGIGPTNESLRSELVYRGANGYTEQRLIDGEYRNFCYSKDDDWTLTENFRFVQNYILKSSYFLPSPAEIDDEGNYRYNEAGTAAIKEQLLAKRGVSIGFHADSSSPSQSMEDGEYISLKNWAHFTWDDAQTNHAVAIVGWDDNYPKENFPEAHQPEGDGAWLVKNSWGSGEEAFPNYGNGTWGLLQGQDQAPYEATSDVHTGYFWLSYYDRSMMLPEALEFDERTQDEGYYLDEYDYMQSGVTKSFFSDTEIRSANLFTAEATEKLKAISFVTVNPETTVKYEVYLLCDGYESPVDGILMASGEKRFRYGGFHKIVLDTPGIVQRGQTYSIVITNVEENGYYSIPLSFSYGESWADLRGGVYSVAVVNPGESMLYDKGKWGDLTDAEFCRDKFGAFMEDNGLVFDNCMIKGFCEVCPDVALTVSCSQKSLVFHDSEKNSRKAATMNISFSGASDHEIGSPEIRWELADGGDEILELEVSSNKSRAVAKAVGVGNTHVIVTVEGAGQRVIPIKVLYADPINVELYRPDEALWNANYYIYTGQPILPKCKVQSYGGLPLEEGKDYTISYEDNVLCGTGKLIVKAAGQCLNPEDPYVNEQYFAIVPPKAEIESTTADGTKLRVNMKDLKETGFDGYVLFYRKTGTEEWSSVKYTAESSELILTGLEAKTEYELVAVDFVLMSEEAVDRGMDEVYYGEFSDTVTAKTGSKSSGGQVNPPEPAEEEPEEEPQKPEEGEKPQTKKYSSEWVNGKWYDADGGQTYKPTGSWKSNRKGSWYQDTSGWYPKNKWQKIDGKWYYFDAKGYQEKDAYQNGYYLKADGSWDGKSEKAGWKESPYGWYFNRSDGSMLKNTWQKIDGKWYYFKADGFAAQNEFVQGWWLGKNCTWNDPVRYSWHKSGSKWWYGTKDGWYAKSKSYTIDGKKYTFDKKGYTK